jgi:3D (Asp-Asp-Asp) domain-containing protein
VMVRVVGLLGGPRRLVGRAAIAVVVLLLIVAACGYAWAAKNVTLIVDGVETASFSLRMTVGGLLADAGIALHPRDVVEPGPADRIWDGGTVTVRRAISLTIVVDGDAVETMSAQPLAGEVVLEAGIELGPDDRTEVAGEFEAGAVIRVVRVHKEYETRLWRIPRKVTRRDDDSLPIGVTRVIEKGHDGVEEVVFCTTFEDGTKIRTEIVERRVVTEPVAEMLVAGTSGQISRGGETIDFRRAMVMTATAYYWGPESTGKWADGYTATGLKAVKGVIAVDPRVIPLGTRVYVDGYGYAIAGDVGSAIKGNKIDLCYDTLAEALAWGRRTVTLYILR